MKSLECGIHGPEIVPNRGIRLHQVDAHARPLGALAGEDEIHHLILFAPDHRRQLGGGPTIDDSKATAGQVLAAGGQGVGQRGQTVGMRVSVGQRLSRPLPERVGLVRGEEEQLRALIKAFLRWRRRIVEIGLGRVDDDLVWSILMSAVGSPRRPLPEAAVTMLSIGFFFLFFSFFFFLCFVLIAFLRHVAQAPSQDLGQGRAIGVG